MPLVRRHPRAVIGRCTESRPETKAETTTNVAKLPPSVAPIGDGTTIFFDCGVARCLHGNSDTFSDHAVCIRDVVV
eukprot:COSAG02_NODE_3870_length_6117_cov_7.546195_5_plen_76_part_00